MEEQILLFFHKTIANPFLDLLMVFFTEKGWLLVSIFVMIFLLKKYREKQYETILYFITALIVGFFLSDWFSAEIKNLIKRIRPCWIIDFRHVVVCTASGSLPSNHASNALAGALICGLFLKYNFSNGLLKKLLYLYIISGAAFVCISRIYLGVHWPSDILAGALIGAIIGFTTYQITMRINSIKRLFYFSLILVTLFRIYFILHSPVDISPDEAHYWEWSRRLDLSYYSKGPMIAYLIAFSTWIFGDNPLGIRFLAIVCSFLSSIFVYRIGKKLFSDKVGYIAGVLFHLIPLFSVYGVIFTIDSPFIFFWVVSIYLFLLAIDGRKGYWLILGVFIGFGLLTKYTMAFFYICMFFYLLKITGKSSSLFQYGRIKDFKNPMLYLCIFISLIVFSPVIIWNFQHDWVTLKHTAGQAHIYDGFKISLKYFVEFLASQLLVVTPLVFISAFYFLLKPSVLNLQPNTRWFLISFSVPILVFFLIKSLQGKVQANWAMTAYIPFLLIIAYFFEKKLYRKVIISSIILAFIFTVLSYAVPFLNLPAKMDPSSRLKGWKELGIKVSEIKRELEKDGEVLIFSDRYQISSELAFYVKGNPTVYCINLGRRMNQYDLWQPINSQLKPEIKTHGIYVIYGIKESPDMEVVSAFEKCIPENFTAYKKGVKIRDYTIFKCYNFKGINVKKPENY